MQGSFNAMKGKLAVVYDTANVIGCISRGEIEEKHVLSPLLISCMPITAILPIVKRDLASIGGWNDIIERIRSIAENKVKSFDLYKTEGEFSRDGLTEVQQALKAIELLDDVRQVARVRFTEFYRCYLVIDLNPEIRTDEEVEVLTHLVREVRECKGASPREAVEDVQMYLLPYLDLLRQGRFAVLLVTDDACFRGLVSAYSTLRKLNVGVIEARLLANARRLARRLSEALRSSSSDSR
jgi:hypothetical protein